MVYFFGSQLAKVANDADRKVTEVADDLSEVRKDLSDLQEKVNHLAKMGKGGREIEEFRAIQLPAEATKYKLP